MAFGDAYLDKLEAFNKRQRDNRRAGPTFCPRCGLTFDVDGQTRTCPMGHYAWRNGRRVPELETVA